jgi:hypothetical protein
MSDQQVKLLREAAESMVAWFDAEDKNLGSFHDRMDLCKHAEWTARKALGQDVGEFEGVPRLILTIGMKEEG